VTDGGPSGVPFASDRGLPAPAAAADCTVSKHARSGGGDNRPRPRTLRTATRQLTLAASSPPHPGREAEGRHPCGDQPETNRDEQDRACARARQNTGWSFR
jgi:hypothetical protein